MNDSFKLKQRQKEEIRRLKRICFPPKGTLCFHSDKEGSPSGLPSANSVSRSHAALQMRQECDRILQNLPTQSRNGFERFKSALRKASVQENLRNEKKFKSLERNFQRFSERYSSRSFRQLSGMPFNRSIDNLADNKENVFTSNLDISPIRHNTSLAQNYLSLNQSLIEGVHDAGHFPAHYEESRAVINRVCDQMGVFFHRVLHGMIQMSVTNAQEIELRKRLADHLGSIQRFRLTINNAFDGDTRQYISQQASQRSAALAFQELLQAFNVSIAELSTRFEGLVSKIQAVSSHSFQKYKMKDICALFDTLCEQFHRMHVLDFVPLLSQKYTDLRVANGLTQFSKFLALRNIKQKRQVLRLLQHDTELKDQRLKDMKKRSAVRILNNIGARREERAISSSLVRWTRTTVSGVKLANLQRVHKEEGVQEATTSLFESLISRTPESSTLFIEAASVLRKLVFGNSNEGVVDFIAYDQAKRTAYTYGEKGEEIAYEGNDLQHSILGKVIQFQEIYNSGEANQEANFNGLVDVSGKHRLILITRINSKSKTHSRSGSYKNQTQALLYFPVFNKHKEFTGVLRLTQASKTTRFSAHTVENVSRFAQALGSIVQDYLHSNKQFTHLQSELISISSRNSVHQIQLKAAQDMYELFCQATQTKKRTDLFHLVRKACLCTFGSSDITFSLFTYDPETQEIQHLKKKTGEIEPFKEGMKGFDFLMKVIKQRKPIEKKDTKVLHRAKPQEQTIFTVIIPIFQNNRSLEHSSLNSSLAAGSTVGSSNIMALVRMEKAMSSEEAEQLPNKRFFLGRPHSPIFVEAEESEEQRLSNFCNFMGCIVSRVLSLGDLNQSSLTFEMSTLKSDNILLAKRLQFAQDFQDELNASPKSSIRYFDELQELLQRLIRKHLPQTRFVRLFLRSLYDEDILVGLSDLNPVTNNSQTNSYSITMRESKDGRIVYSGEHSRRVSLLNKSNPHLYHTSDPKFGGISRIPSRHESAQLTTTQLPSAKFTSFINSSRPQEQGFSSVPSPPNQDMTHSSTKHLIQSGSGLYISTPSYQDHLIELSTVSVLAEGIKSKHVLNIPDVTMHVNFQPLLDLPEQISATKPLSILLLPLLNGTDLEGLVQLAGYPDAMGASCFSEEDEFILAAVCEKLRGVIANQRKHNRETMDLRGKLEQTENQLDHSTNVNQTLLAINTFISTQVPCKSLPLFANATSFFLSKLFNCQSVRLVIVDHIRDSLIDFPGDCNRTLFTQLTTALAQEDSDGLALRSLRNGTSMMLGEREELGQYIVNQNALVEWMDRNAFLNLILPEVDVSLNIDSIQNFLQVPLQLDSQNKGSRIGVLQLFNRSSVQGDYEFNSTDVSLLQLVAQSLAPTIGKLRVQFQVMTQIIFKEAARIKSPHEMVWLEIRPDQADKLPSNCLPSPGKLDLHQRDKKLFKFFSKHNERQVFRAFNVFRRRTFQISIKQHALSAMLGSLNSRFEGVPQTPEVNLSFNSFMIPFEFRAVQCLPPLLTKWESRIMAPYFHKWIVLSRKRIQLDQLINRRCRILRSILKFQKQRSTAGLYRRAQDLFFRWRHLSLRLNSFQSLMSRIFRRKLSKSKIHFFEQWQKFVLMRRFECHSRMLSKTQALKKFLRLKGEMRQKEKSRALSSWLNITRQLARMDFECQKNESMIAEQAHREQNFLNSLYECCCFFEHSEAAGLKQLVALNTGSFNVVLNSPQVRGFFKIIRNYLSQQVDFKECLFTLKLSFVHGHFFAIKLGSSPPQTLQSGLFSNRSRDYSQISELMKGVDLSEASGDEANNHGVYLNTDQDHILRMLTQRRRENALLLQNIHRDTDLKPTLENRGVQSSLRAAAVVPLNIFTFNTEPGTDGGIPSMIGTHTLLPEVNNCEVIGSIELYRAQNSFEQEDLNVLKSIGNAVAPCVLSFCSALRNLYFSSREELFNPTSYVRQLQGNSTLSKVSKFFVKNPQLFQGAEKALVIHLPMSQTEKSHVAFFYSFQDSHIYNFDYADTFIEQIVLTQVPLMFEHSKSVTEQANSDAPFYNFIRYIPILSSGSQISHNFHALKNAINAPNNPQRVVAVLELCHERVGHSFEPLVRPQELAEKEIEITQALGNHLAWIRDKVKTFINILSGVDRFHKLKSLNRRFQIWKKSARGEMQSSQVKKARGKMSSLEDQIFEIEGSMAQYQNTIEQYQSKIAQMEQKLNESIESRDQLSQDLESMKLEKKAKLKFLAAALIFGQMETATSGAMRMRNSFDHWKAHSVCLKIAESAFNKVLELNHKHAMARFQTATFLVGSFAKKFEKRMRYFTLRSIVHHAAVMEDHPPIRKVLASHSGVLTIGNRQHTPPPGSRKGSIVSRRSLSKENAKPSSPYLTPNSNKKSTKRGSSTKRNY